MFTILSDHIILTGLILLFLLFSIICQIISAVIYQNMINQADNMSSTENKLLKQCKQKYTSHYKLNGKMINTSCFCGQVPAKNQCWRNLFVPPVPYFRAVDDAFCINYRDYHLLLIIRRKFLISDYALLYDQYTGIVFVFFNFRYFGHTGKKGYIKDKPD